MHTRVRRSVATAASAALSFIGLALLSTSNAQAAQPSDPGPPNTMPSIVPSSKTPAVDNGRVYGIAQVGNTMVIAGTFTSVAGQSRSYVAAFDKTTGTLTSFAPTLNNYVNQVIPGPNDHTVFLGGKFTSVNGVTTRYLTELDLNTGQKVSTFKPPTVQYNEVKDLALRGNQLYIVGTFTALGGVPHGGIAALNATTGALDPFMNVQFTGHHNTVSGGAQGPVGPSDLDVTADGSKMVVVGNFKNADGVVHDQVAVINLTGATAQVQADWNTTRYYPTCHYTSFDQNVRGVALSPDGSYFVVTATGGAQLGSLCDAASRFELNATGSDIQPTWIDQSGGDTVWGVTVTGTAVFVGGHNRWMNNPLGANAAKAGAVPRPGIEALDPQTGRPMAWNPGRLPLGVSAFAFFGTSDGLWVGSDSDYIGDYKYKRPKLAFFPYSTGYTPASTATATLPGNVMLASNGSSTNQLRSVGFDGTTAQAAQNLSTQGIDFNNWRGAFAAGNTVFYGYTDGFLYSRSFDGATFGPAFKIDPYHDPLWKDVQTGDGQTFNGASPSLYGQLKSSVTAMAYAKGRMYYTLRNDSRLYSRWFLPDSGIVDETTATASSTVNFSQAGGLFIVANTLYYSSRTDGSLRAVSFSSNGASGGIVSGTPTVVGSGVDWRNTAAFLFNPPPPNQPPIAAFTSNCTDLNCDLDGSASSDSDGTIASYSWDFGDSTNGSGVAPSHSYASSGTYTVNLTVTDDDGSTNTVSHDVTVTAPAGNNLAFVAAADAGGGNVKTKTVGVPAATQAGNLMLLTVAQTSTSTWTDPTGWTKVDTATSGTLTSTVWSKIATASDAGSRVQITSGAYTHASMQLAVYSGVDTANPIRAVTHAGDTSKANHVTPTVTAGSGDWVASIWTDRSSATRTWTPPGSVTARNASSDSGLMTVQGLVADTGDIVSAGDYGGLMASTDASTGSAVMFSVALKAAP
jgi:PKD repeat protein